jgi:hypothetical protein
MVKEGVFILVLLLILALPLTFATDLTLKAPSFEAIRQNEDFTFIVHAFNTTSGKPITNSIGCYFHLYNKSSTLILEMEDNAINNNFDYSFNVKGGNFTEAGHYAYTVNCNTTDTGGYISNPLEVTNSGNKQNANNILFGIIAVWFLIIAFYVAMIRMFKLDLFTEHAGIKMFFMVGSFWLLLIPLSITIQFNEFLGGPEGVTIMLNNIIPWVFWFNIFLTLYFIMFFIISMLRNLQGYRNDNL